MINHNKYKQFLIFFWIFWLFLCPKSQKIQKKTRIVYIYNDLTFVSGFFDFFGFPGTEFDGWPASLPTIEFCTRKAKKPKKPEKNVKSL